MKFFADTVINPYIRRAGYRRVCEIGASLGENSDKLLETESIHLTVIDPCIDTDLKTKLRGDQRVQICKGLSLEILFRTSEQFDCILIDGDHNWYTVYHELETIADRKLLREGGTIFLHDVGWPYGRRDMYYQPETIPAEFLQPYATRGIVQGVSELSEDSGINAGHFNAMHEGGPRNGVLTAVEDFLQAHRGYLFLMLTEQNGLGVLYRKGDFRSRLPFARLWLRASRPRLVRGLRRVRGLVPFSLKQL